MSIDKVIRFKQQDDKIMENIRIFINGISWLCFVLMPWALFAGLADLAGVIELSPLELKVTVATLVGAMIQAVLCSQK